MKGLSVRNLKYMRTLARELPEGSIGQQLAAQLPWFHSCTLVQKVKDPGEREWYARACIEHGWSRNVLEMQIETGLYHRQGGAATNFERTLPAPRSDLARETLKDPYNFEFLTIAEDAHERAIERGLVDHIRYFLLELGQGFAFMGSQVQITVGDEDYYLDLLFYHVKLRCYVVIELKAGGFQPEHAGKLNFYLSAVDDLLRHPDDQPSIGLVLCRGKNEGRGKNEVAVEYSLRDMPKPLGVSEYQLTEALPEKLKGVLPSVEELEAELEGLSDDECSRESSRATQEWRIRCAGLHQRTRSRGITSRTPCHPQTRTWLLRPSRTPTCSTSLEVPSWDPSTQETKQIHPTTMLTVDPEQRAEHGAELR